MSADPTAALPGLLARWLPGANLRACERLSGGASQETWRIVLDTAEGERCFALRRSSGPSPTVIAGASLGLDAEARLMLAAQAAGVPVPRVARVLEKDDGLGEGYLTHWLEGETLGAQIVRGEAFTRARAGLARRCGEVLARIHAIDLDAQRLRPILRERTPEQLVRESWELYQAYGTPQPAIDYTARWLLQHLPPPVPPRLVHGDCRTGNLMVSPQEGLVGVLDWELAHIGDPLRDLGWLCTNSWRFGRTELPVGGFGQLDELLDGYASVSGVRPGREAVRWWIVFGSFWWAVGTLTMTRLHRLGVGRSVERLVIGRRTSECQADCMNLIAPGRVLAPPAALSPSVLEMPCADEVLGATAAMLRDQAGGVTGRAAFMNKVAANALDIVQREAQLGLACRERELQGLKRLLRKEGGVQPLREELVRGLRDGSLQPGPELGDHLRQCVADQLAIDQPKYKPITGEI